MNKLSILPVLAVSAAFVAGLLSFPKPCEACLGGPLHHEIDPEEEMLDSTPPGPVRVISAEITRRGTAPRGLSGSSIDDLGALQIELFPPDDDRTPPDLMGYRIEATDDDAPEGLVPRYDVRAADGVIFLSWVDGANDNQEPLDFCLRISAVDLGGNVGQGETLRILHPGSGGCSSSGGFYFEPVLLLLLLYLVKRRASGCH